MLHPNQFKVNEAWIAFRLNDVPIHTDQDGDFDFVALMDAASCVILSSTPIPSAQLEPNAAESKRLLDDGQNHKGLLPKTLFVPVELPAELLAAEAKRLDIEIIRVTKEQLLPFIGEALESFRESFGQPRVH
jgi:hypothetical protein